MNYHDFIVSYHVQKYYFYIEGQVQYEYSTSMSTVQYSTVWVYSTCYTYDLLSLVDFENQVLKNKNLVPFSFRSILNKEQITNEKNIELIWKLKGGGNCSVGLMFENFIQSEANLVQLFI